jgi:hypothetical protein
MDILSTWLGRLAVFLVAFPVVMLGVPFLIATLRQRFAWDKRRPADVGLRGLPPDNSGVPVDSTLDDLVRQPRKGRYTA